MALRAKDKDAMETFLKSIEVCAKECCYMFEPAYTPYHKSDTVVRPIPVTTIVLSDAEKEKIVWAFAQWVKRTLSKVTKCESGSINFNRGVIIVKKKETTCQPQRRQKDQTLPKS